MTRIGAGETPGEAKGQRLTAAVPGGVSYFFPGLCAVEDV